MMIKRVFKSMLLTGLLVGALGFATVVQAEQTAPVTVNWHVDYTKGKLDDSSFNATEFDNKLGSMQPGDRAIFTITLNNKTTNATRWYMENEVIKSMERLATDTGAYTYKLTYNGADINNAEEQGGENREGMTPATAGLENFFELGEIASGGSGTVKLELELEGESQGNSYQNAQARLRFHFAVDEKTSTGTNVTPVPGTTTVVKTGDDGRILLYFAIVGSAGIVLLMLALVATRMRKQEQRVNTRNKKGGR